MSFRSKGATSGLFREPRTIHAHIDAGGHRLIRKVESIVRELDAQHLKCKENEVVASFPNPDKHEDFKKTYANHKPGTEDEEFSVFSTIKFRNLAPKAVALKIKQLFAYFSRMPGVVIEVERVLAVVRNGEWRKPVDLIASLDDGIVGHETLETHPIEIHLAFDLPKAGFSSNGNPRISLNELFEATDTRGLTVGEWFLFDKGKFWSYRSSRFLELDSYEEVAHDDHALMSEWLCKRFGPTIKSWTLIEQILGLWKTSESARVTYSTSKNLGGSRIFGHSLTLPQLGRWERSFPRLEHFWGVVPNFLGDTSPEIEAAMLFNLRERKTIYTYFLYSYADLQRLKAFRQRLERKLKRADLSDQIRPILLTRRPESNARLGGEYFIANPNHGKAEGYRLERNYGRHVTGGQRLSKEECQEAISALSPLLDRPIQGFRPEIIIGSVSEPILAIVYTDLENSVKKRNNTPRPIWDQMLEDYDQMIAGETSRAEGEVIKSLGDGYLLKFPLPKAAFDFAVRAQKALDRYNASRDERHRLPNQRIALDCGQVRRVQRSHGSDLEGRILSRCARVMDLKRHKGKHILMTRPFRDQLSEVPPTFGASIETIKPLGFADLKGFGPVELFELIWRNSNGVPIKPLRKFGAPRTTERRKL